MGNSSSRNDVIRALRAHEVYVCVEDESKNLYNVERGDFLESICTSHNGSDAPSARFQEEAKNSDSALLET